jgi:formate-nitrite transporter family protein
VTDDSNNAQEVSPGVREPLVSYRAMFDAEVVQAVSELRRPWLALFMSGVIAGAAVGVAVPLLAMLVADLGGMPESFATRLLFGSAYAAGFALAILARTDLFTEYTTIAIFPVLTGASRLRSLARLWGLVYAGNMVGALLAAAAVVGMGRMLHLFEARDLVLLAEDLAQHSSWAILLSAVIAGWLMGLLAWLIAGGRDTTSQILFIWIIGTLIGLFGLHHAITGAVELFAAGLADPSVRFGDVARVVFWTTLGNALGGVVFAVVIRQGVQMPMTDATPGGDREEGRQERWRR